MKIICIYPGRFQPFGPHHFKSYKWLCEVFGLENVFIATSNVVNENSPLTFEEKVKCMQMYNLNPNMIVQVRNPYKSEEITSRFNPNETAVIFAYGEKDFGRIKFNGGYFKEYYGQKNLQPLNQCGYAVSMPDANLKFNGHEINGSYLRQVLPLCKAEEFRQIMGYYDEGIHFLFKKKFHPDIVQFTEQVLNENTITKTQLQRIEQYADRLFQEYGIDINFQDLTKGTHFWQRLNDPRNVTQITTDELRQLFKKASTKFGNKLSQSPIGFEAILKDIETDINMPFMLKYDSQNKELDLVPKTIMRKQNFKSTSPVLNLENKQVYSKHICHLYEDERLTQDQIIEIVETLMKNPPKATIKYDGCNLRVTYKNGQVLAARNKTTTLNPMTRTELKEKYKLKPNIQFVFVNALTEISNLLLRLGTNKLNEIFKNGKVFLNFEVQHPKVKMHYNSKEALLSLHSLVEYDEKGYQINESLDIPFEPKNGKIFKIQKTPIFELKPLQDPVSEQFILNNLREGRLIKETILLFENLIIKNFCKQYPQPNDPIKELVQVVNEVEFLAENEKEKLDVKEGLRLLEYVGGIDSINPIEGLVFKIDNQTYKCTGAFGALRPLLNVYSKHTFHKKMG